MTTTKQKDEMQRQAREEVSLGATIETAPEKPVQPASTDKCICEDGFGLNLSCKAHDEKPAQHSPRTDDAEILPMVALASLEVVEAELKRVKAERDAETLKRKTAENENKRLIREREAGWGSVIAERDELLTAAKAALNDVNTARRHAYNGSSGNPDDMTFDAIENTLEPSTRLLQAAIEGKQ